MTQPASRSRLSMRLNRTFRPALLALTVSTQSWPTVVSMVVADSLGLALAGAIAVRLGLWIDGALLSSPSSYLPLNAAAGAVRPGLCHGWPLSRRCRQPGG